MFVQSDRIIFPALMRAGRLAAIGLFLILLARALWDLPIRSEVGTPWRAKPYFRAMNGELNLYGDTVYPDTPDIQRAIRRHQNPPDCSRARFLVFELWNHGLGSDYLGASAALALAVAHGRVLQIVEPREGWIHGEGCLDTGPECFFQPVSRCAIPANVSGANATEVDLSLGYLPATDKQYIVLRRGRPHLAPVRNNLSTLLRAAHTRLGLSDPQPKRVYGLPPGYEEVRRGHTQASLYLLRLNGRMQEVVREGLSGCAGGEDEDVLARRTLGLPLRGSDKCRPPGGVGGEMHCVGPEKVMHALTHIRAAHPWLSAVLITSEDRALAQDVERRIGDRWVVRRNEQDVQQGSGSPGKFGDHATVRVDPYRVTESMLVTLTCQIIPRYHVLTIRSNFHSLIDMLAKVVPGKPAHFSYSIGDRYYPW